MLSLFLLVLLSACAPTSDKFIGPNSLRCERLAVKKQYLIVREGQVTLSKDRPQDLEKVDWYEPNFKVPIEPLQRKEARIPFGSNEALWRRLGISSFWDRGVKGRGVGVAVIDSGVENLPYLTWYENKAEAEGREGVDDDLNGKIDDIRGWNFVSSKNENIDELNHGTQMAHVIAASNNSPIGPGVAPRAQILPLDFMMADGGDELHAIEALDYAVSRGVKMINNSWVTPCSRLLRSKFESYAKLNVLIVNAAGNQGLELSNETGFSSSLSFFNLINVGSLGDDGRRSKFSNYGLHIRLYAPGEGIYIFDGSTSFGFWVMEAAGTSFSAAIVSGLSALLWSEFPEADVGKIKSELLKLAEQPLEPGGYYRLKPR